MDSHVLWEIIGYLGSALVLVSLLMSSIVKLRIINAVGSIIFSVYAFKINSIPTGIMNVCLVIIDLYFLFKLIASKKTFSYLDVSADDPMAKHFLERYSKDMSQFFDISSLSAADRVMVAFDGDTVAGIFAGVSDNDKLNIVVDYATPSYRDCKVGKFFCEILANNYRQLVYAGGNPNHIPYCLKLGYIQENDIYVKNL